MNILLFGATGMIGQGALREALGHGEVDRVTAIVRAPTGRQARKLDEIVVPDLFAIAAAADRLGGYDACLFCTGVSSGGMSEAEYTRVTHDLTLAVATVLLRLNPAMTFVYVSGAGADSSERGRFMWARVKGRTENDLLLMPFKAAYMVRPGMIQPLHGIRSRTAWYRALYAVLAPLTPALLRGFPRFVTTTERLGRAMVTLALRGHSAPILETRDINRLARTQ